MDLTANYIKLHVYVYRGRTERSYLSNIDTKYQEYYFMCILYSSSSPSYCKDLLCRRIRMKESAKSILSLNSSCKTCESTLNFHLQEVDSDLSSFDNLPCDHAPTALSTKYNMVVLFFMFVTVFKQAC